MISGIILVDKPDKMTSFGVVARLRRVLSELNRQQERAAGTPENQIPKKIKVGHAGTLDPFATGLMVVLVGKGTKAAGQFLKQDKEYEATICLGRVSTTGDPEGEITSKEASLPLPSQDDVAATLRNFTGRIEQAVPKYSAVKIGGRRAYNLARRGVEFEAPRRQIEVYSLEVLSYKWPELKIRCRVSSGTYIRTLGEDIGDALGVGGYLTALRRIQSGKYRIEQARPLDELLRHPEKIEILDLPKNPPKGVEKFSKM